MSYLDRIAAAMQSLEDRRLRRIVKEQSDAAGGVLLDFSSNDYLGLAEHPDVVAALRRATRVGSGGARLLAGAFVAHAMLERELAAYVGRERVLLFSSGYHAALGAIGALAPMVGVAYSDALNHASLIDGLRGTRLPRRIYPHLQGPSALRDAAEGEDALVVSESMFGMEGDAIDLRSLVGALRAGDVLLLDEAHALGVAGEGGGGLAYGIDDARIVVMGTLSKAFGAFGGFIAGPAPVIDYFQSTARTFIFDTALPPALAEAARVAVQVARASDAGRSHLAMLGQHLRRGLGVLGYPVPPGSGHIVPVLVGDEASTLALAAALRELGISAPAIRPPTVPAGTCRLRISLRSTHTTDDVDRLLAGLPRR